MGRLINSHFFTRFAALGEFRLTSYTGGDPNQGTGTWTALGDRVQYGMAAVPDWIPLGTYLYIPQYGLAKASDRGGAVGGMHIDLCFGLGGPGSAAYAAALVWATRYGEVYRVPPGLLFLFS